MLAAENALVFERNLKILNKLNAYDFSLFKEYKSALRNLAQGRADLVTYAAELEQTISDLKLQEIKLAEEDLQRKKLLVAENKSSLLIYKGQLSYPTEGQVKLTYGAYRDEQNEYAFLVRGLLFETKKGAKIYAAGPGHVIFRDPIPYWGETIIIQHDDNYYSVYAGVSNMISNLNSFVQANEVVATASKTEFYFELRHFDNTLNPKNWLKDNNEQNIEKNHEQK